MPGRLFQGLLTRGTARIKNRAALTASPFHSLALFFHNFNLSVLTFNVKHADNVV